jgi:glycosyltransferase involved in cell wall biosynthesis
MRIGIYLGDFAPDVGGGFTFQDEVFRAFVSEASAAQHDCVVLGSAEGLPDYVKQNAPQMKVVKVDATVFDRRKEALKTYSPLFRKLLGPGPIERRAASVGLDCLWYVGGGAFEATDTPYVATVWDLQHRMTPWFPEMASNGTWDSRELTYRRFLQRASYIVTGTSVGQAELELCYETGAARVRRLPHPTPSFALSASGGGTGICKRLALDRPFLLYPAQFWAHKNHVTLLHALAVLRDTHGVILPLVLAGSEKGNSKYVRQVAEALGLEQQVIFAGFVTQDELVDLYRGALMLVYASHCGPENLPPLEAFALNCPVVAANVPGAIEQLDGAALLFDPTSSEDMAAVIHEVYTRPELQQILRGEGRKRAEAWTAKDFAQGMLSLFDEFSRLRQCWPPGSSARTAS